MKFKNLAIVSTALLTLASVPAHAIDTLVQFSSNGSGDGVTDGLAGGYDKVAINEFDWQSSGDLIIEDTLPFAATCNGGVCTTFTQWAATAVNLDTIVFDAHLQARLNDMLKNDGSSVAPSLLSTDGGSTTIGGGACGAGCFEVTSATSIQETAVLFNGTLIFQSATGAYKFFYDSTPDSVVATGAGYIDGTAIVQGSVSCTPPACGSFVAGVGGSTFFSNTVTSYNDAYIETDPTSNQPLIGTTFDTLVSLISSGEASVGVGGTVGLAPYTVSLADLGFKADANSEFAGTAVPEPASLALVGLGLFGLVGLRRRYRG